MASPETPEPESNDAVAGLASWADEFDRLANLNPANREDTDRG